MIEAPKLVLYMLGVIFAYCIFSIAAGPTTTNRQDQSCICAAMNSSYPEDYLVERKLGVSLPCNDEGEQQCNKLCEVMANSTKSDPAGRAKFCKYYGRDGLLFVNVFSKHCDKPYLKTGFSDEKPLCCIEGETVLCE